MSNHHEHLGCGCCSVSRRSFLATGCAMSAGVAGAASAALPFVNTARADDGNGNMKVRVIFALHAAVQPGPDWPNVGYDFNPVMERTMSVLNSRCEGIDFIASMANGPEQTKAIIDEDAKAGNIDGYIVMQMNCWNQVVQTAVTSGKPVLYTELHYAGSGGMICYTAGQLRAKTPNFAFITSSNMRHLVAAARCFLIAKDGKNIEGFVEAVTKVRIDNTPDLKPEFKEDKFDMLTTEELLKELKGKKMIEVEQGWNPAAEAPLKEVLGIEIVRIPFAELNDLWEKADKAKAQEIMKQWKDNADVVIGIPEEVIEAAARMYLAEKQCMENHGACAITINCLGGFYGGHIHAYPCLGFHQLLNEGLIGACECDTLSTLTMVVMTTLTKGRPGYISDPVMDVATRQIIYAHCVAATKPFGPQGAANPFTIMTHSEDRQGASLRSTLPLGYMTTTLEMHPVKKEILLHQAKTVANSSDDKACRTKIAGVPVGDFEKLFTEWDQWGWHRVTYYGDLKQPVFALADAIGWKVVEEA